MNDFNFSVSIWILIISIILRLLAAWDFLYVIRRALAEANVKNGLEKLRKQLLANACILMFIAVSGLLLVIIRPFVSPDVVTMATNILVLLNSIGFFVDAKIKRAIYSQQYSDESKENHRQIQNIKDRKRLDSK